MFFETTLYVLRYKIVRCETQRKLLLSRNFLNFKYLKIATKLASSIENFENNTEALAVARGCFKANILHHDRHH